MVDVLAVLALLALLPVTPFQIYKNFKNKSAAGVSSYTFIFLLAGLILFFIVSVATSAHIAITINYLWGIFGSSTVVFQKYYYGKREAEAEFSANLSREEKSSELCVDPIGVVSNGVHKRKDVDSWSNICSYVAVRQDMADALNGVDEYTHVYILYRLNRIDPDEVIFGSITPYGLSDVPEKGIFATRMRQRPNRIALALAQVVAIDGNTLVVKGLDAFHGSPVLDIKPFTGNPKDVPEEYSIPKWAEKVNT